jgi:hypothetical protein
MNLLALSPLDWLQLLSIALGLVSLWRTGDGRADAFLWSAAGNSAALALNLYAGLWLLTIQNGVTYAFLWRAWRKWRPTAPPPAVCLDPPFYNDNLERIAA